MRVSAIIAAAGVGRRFGGETPKQFLSLGGRPILAWSIDALAGSPPVRELIIVSPSGDEEPLVETVKDFTHSIEVKVVQGGATRQESVKLGLAAVDPECEWVAVHDAARPLVTVPQVEAVCLMAQEVGAAILGTPVRDTVKEVDEDGIILRTRDRSRLFLAQTPQVCRKTDLAAAYELAREQGFRTTDEAGLLEALGVTVGIVESGPRNMKITGPEDLEIAQAIVAFQSRG